MQTGRQDEMTFAKGAGVAKLGIRPSARAMTTETIARMIAPARKEMQAAATGRSFAGLSPT